MSAKKMGYEKYKTDERICLQCGKKFKTGKSSSQKFCSISCGLRSHRGTTLITQICPQCGEQFRRERWKHQKFCSSKCATKSHRGITLITKICPQCNKQFQSEPWRRRKFCSFECGVEFNRGKSRKRRSNSKLITRTRYRPERKTKNGKRIALHRYIMEQALERSLSESETVHHIDCDSDNNKINNLFLFPNESEHIKAHHSLEPLVKILLSKEIVVFRNGRYHLAE